MKEIILTGKHYRVMGSILKKVWYRVSFWTAAKDIEFKDGTTLEEKYNEGNITLSPTDWVEHTEGEDTYYKINKSFTKVTDAHPYISLLPSQGAFPSVDELENYSYITAAKVNEDNTLTFYALKKPSLNLYLNIRGVIE